MGDALDDLYDQMEYCKKHDIWYEELGFGCPKCKWTAECDHPNTAEASAISGASVWCPDCEDWVRLAKEVEK